MRQKVGVLQRAVVLACCSTVASACAAQSVDAAKQQDKHIRINQIQVVGSHNSYHAGFAPSEAKWLAEKNPRGYRSLEYRHAPLDEQLSGGVRQLEIDIFSDAKGGLFSHPKIVQMVKDAGLPADPEFDPKHEMDKPGFKVMHIQDIDERTFCHTFVACLQTVRGWSKSHPGHLPIFLLIETKEGDMKDMPDAAKTEPFTSGVFDAMDAEIRSVFNQDEMITPDVVRGRYPTLEKAVLAGNWPTLAQARGKVVFLMDQKKAGPIYATGHPSLKGRVLFTNADPGQPDAAFVEENDGTKEEIDSLARRGYLVRTRSDEGTEAARTNDTKRRDTALASGAQMVSTDYPPSEPSQWTSYVVKLPGGVTGRCNPVNAPAGCKSDLLEEGAPQ